MIEIVLNYAPIIKTLLNKVDLKKNEWKNINKTNKNKSLVR